MNKLAFAVLALLAVGATAPAVAAPLIGTDFEGGTGDFALTGNVAVISGADYVAFANGAGTAAAQANHFASFGAGNVAGLGLVSRSFTALAGRTYKLSFDYGAFNNTGQTLGYSVAGIAGNAPASTGTSNLDALFSRFTTTFTGNGTTVLAFSSTSAGGDNADILLDNISVTAVPEPASWALMILGFGAVGGAMRRRARARTTVAFA